jgi:hypothetical protein
MPKAVRMRGQAGKNGANFSMDPANPVCYTVDIAVAL